MIEWLLGIFGLAVAAGWVAGIVIFVVTVIPLTIGVILYSLIIERFFKSREEKRAAPERSRRSREAREGE